MIVLNWLKFVYSSLLLIMERNWIILDNYFLRDINFG
jgi:hypothetical protein